MGKYKYVNATEKTPLYEALAQRRYYWKNRKRIREYNRINNQQRRAREDSPSYGGVEKREEKPFPEKK